MIEAYSLYSGSSGNAYLVRHGETSILVDGGKSSAALCRSLRAVGCEPEDISAVLITHEHIDHTSALRVFNKKYRIPLIGATPVLSAVCENEGMCDCARALAPGREFYVGSVCVCGCATPHDSAANMCYSFSTDEGDRLVIATDMGEVTGECAEFLSGATCAVIEANHDPEMLKFGSYPPKLKSRIASKWGHLSNEQCADLAVGLARSGATGFVLAHLSHENNTPELALATVSDMLERSGFAGLPVACAGENSCVRVRVSDGKCEICCD